MQTNKPKISRGKIAAFAYIGVLLFVICVLLSHTSAELKAKREIVDASESANQYFAHIYLFAKAAYVYDVSEGKVIFKKNEHAPLPIASITKIMTALCALDRLGANGEVAVDNSAGLPIELNDLVVGEKWKVSDLVSYMLIESSNIAATSLANAFGGSPDMVSCMNSKAEELGLFDTKFANESGLDIGSSPGAYGSAENMAKLLDIALRRYTKIFETTANTSYNISSLWGVMHNAINTDRAIESLPRLIASKTGLTDLAGGNLVFAIEPVQGHIVIVSVLGSTEQGRFSDAIALSNAATQYIENKQ